MRETSHHAIVWKVLPYAEGDALVQLLTAEEGKITVLAKGLRKMKSKRLGLVQPFSILKINRTVPTHEQSLPILLRSELEFKPHLRDAIVLSELSLLVEICQHFLGERQHVHGVFELWETFLKIQFTSPMSEICGFLLQFLSKLGIFPDIRHCAKCGTKFSEEKKVLWGEENGFICCEAPSSLSTPLSFPELKCLLFWQLNSVTDFHKIRLSPLQEKHLFEFLLSYKSPMGTKPFPAAVVLKSLMNANLNCLNK
jgi:DNA repair protein RecO (recombination protein O)